MSTEHDIKELRELLRGDLILIKDSLAVRASGIARMHWRDDHRILEIVFDDTFVPATNNRFWKLEGEEAFEFWEHYTGQRVSWDTRPIEVKE